MQKLNSSMFASNLRKSGISQMIEKSLALDSVENLIRQKIKKPLIDQIKPLYIKNECLFIRVSDSIVSSFLKQQESELLAAVNAKSSHKIKRICFIL